MTAARAAEQRLASGAETPSDCAAIELAAEPNGGARLRFTTVAGRSATRELQAPSELVPALEALYVTFALPPPPAAHAAATAATPPAAPAPPAVRAHFLLGAGVGGRFTLPRRYLAPTIAVRGSVVLNQVELGVFAGWDPIYARLAGATPADFAMSSVLVNAACGGRSPAGRAELDYGVTIGIASVASSARDAPRFGRSRSVDAAEPRLGAYFGTGFPRDSSTRARVELRADAALAGLRGPATTELELPPLPRYGLVLCAGFETGAL